MQRKQLLCVIQSKGNILYNVHALQDKSLKVTRISGSGLPCTVNANSNNLTDVVEYFKNQPTTLSVRMCNS